MVSLRQHCKYLLLIVPVVLIWSQSLAAGHDQLHNHVSDDCVICKIAENGSANTNLMDVSFTAISHSEDVFTFIINVVVNTNLWISPLTRAPPAS